MAGVIFLVSNLFLVLLLGAFTMGMHRLSRGKIFGVNLPNGRENDERVQDIVLKYRKNSRLWFVFSLVTAMLVLIPTPFFSVVYTIFLIWTTVVIVLKFKIIGTARKAMIELKHQVGWYDPTRDVEETYWKGGFFYNNPNSDKMFVSKSAFGYGSTVNMATKGGRRFMMVTAVILFLSLVPSWGLIVLDDIQQPSVKVDGNDLVVKSAMNKATIPLSEIVSVELREDVVIGTKINGSGTSLYSRGKFYVGEFGKCNVFRFKNVEPLIVIQQKNGIPLIFNLKTESETLEWYYKLIS